WLIEVRSISKWSFPLIVIGMNSIFIYLLHNLLQGWFMETSGVFINPLEGFIGAWINPLKYSVSLLVQWLVCFWLYQRKIFFKI
ncbi:MAG: hypothetical protein ACETWQ_05905, partial [Phycisphaerae bacterium]